MGETVLSKARLITMRSFELQGHRGARGLRPENTLPSFEFALDVGVNSVETDVHLTADEVPVLFHDAMLNERICRPTKTSTFSAQPKPLLRQLTLKELRCFCADGNPDPQRFPEQVPQITPLAELFGREHGLNPFAIPTVADLFAFVQAYVGEMGIRVGKTEDQQANASRLIVDLEFKRVPFFPETMGDGFQGSEPGLLEKRVLREIVQANMLARVRIRSFDHRSVEAIKILEPALQTAVLIAETTPVSPGLLARQAGATWYCPDWRFVDEASIRQAHLENVRVLPWTVNDPAHWSQLLAWGVDGLTTDYPDHLAKFLSLCNHSD
jgi:glycerophosphoryl diester phosphodiesterase